MKTVKAQDLKTGMVYHDGCEIKVISSTKCFVNCLVGNGPGMEGRHVEFKWKKTSDIIILSV